MSHTPPKKVFKERKEQFTLDSGIEIKAIYPPVNQIVEAPGEYPFTRGVHAGMYRSRLWTMRQYAGFSTAEESNKRYHYLLQQGTSGLSVAFDLPTQIGYDSDHDFAEGEVGKVGVAIDSIRDMETLFEGIELQKISTNNKKKFIFFIKRVFSFIFYIITFFIAYNFLIAIN